MKNAIAGAGSGAALGPWGALGGAMLGGFMGPEQTEMYTSQNYLKDMEVKEMGDITVKEVNRNINWEHVRYVVYPIRN